MFTITNIIVVITCLVSFAAFNNEKLRNDMLFWPAEISSRNQFYRFLSYGLVHADLMHLAFNMLALYSFGQFVEKNLFSNPNLFGTRGSIFYLVLYVSALIVSTIPDYYKNKNNYDYRALGASGAVSAVIFAGIMIEPRLPIQIFFIPWAIPGFLFAPIFLALSAYLSKKGSDNIGHLAHISGALYGLLFTLVVARLFANYDVMQGLFDAFSRRPR